MPAMTDFAPVTAKTFAAGEHQAAQTADRRRRTLSPVGRRDNRFRPVLSLWCPVLPSQSIGLAMRMFIGLTIVLLAAFTGSLSA